MNIFKKNKEQKDERRLLEIVANKEEGWQRAFNMLYNIHEKQLAAYVFARVGEDGTDIVQEIWKTLYEKAPIFLDSMNNASLLPLLITIARNLITDYYRRKAVRRIIIRYEEAVRKSCNEGQDDYLPEEQLAAEEFNELTTAEVVTNNELHLRVKLALEKLPPIDRTIYYMRHEGYTLSEIAENIGMALQTVKGRSAQITKYLKNKIKHDYE